MKSPLAVHTPARARGNPLQASRWAKGGWQVEKRRAGKGKMSPTPAGTNEYFVVEEGGRKSVDDTHFHLGVFELSDL